MWGLLAKQALKGGIKKVAKDRLLNRKKKTPQKRVSGKEMSAGVMNKGKPGTLAVRPTTSLVHSARDFDPVSTSAGESDIVIIRKQVIQVRDILKDSHTAKEAEKKNLKKAKQLDKKKKEEDKVEEPKVKPKQAKAGMKMPSLGLGIGTFFTWLAVGLIFARLEKLMPTLKKIFGVLKFVTKFIEGVLNFALGFVVGFIDLAYAGVENLRELIVGIGGEGAGELFDKFGRLFTQVMNGALIAATIGAMIGRGRDKLPKDRTKGRWRKALERWFKKTAPGRFIRNQLILPLKLLGRRFSKTVVGRTLNALRPTQIGKFINEGGIDKVLKSAGSNLLQLGKRSVNQFSKLELGKKFKDFMPKIDDVTKRINVSDLLRSGKERVKGWTNVIGDTARSVNWRKVGQTIDAVLFPKKFFPDWMTTPFKKGSWLRRTGSSAIEGTRQFAGEAKKRAGRVIGSSWNLVKSIPQKTSNLLKGVDWGKFSGYNWAKENFQSAIGGMSKWMDEVGKNLPVGKMVTEMMEKMKGNVDQFIGNNAWIKKLRSGMTKDAFLDWIAKNLDDFRKFAEPTATFARNNPAIKQMTNYLGPVDVAVDALFALVDYGLGGESLVNAIVSAISSSLGFAAGASLATLILAKFGIGTAGIGVVATGMPAWAGPVILGSGLVGAWQGQNIANIILSGLVKAFPGIGEWDDPIAPRMGLTPRKIMRDTFGPKPEDLLPLVGKEDNSNNLSSSTTSSANLIASSDGNNTRANGLDTKTTYDKTVVIHDTTYIQPIEV